MNGKGRWLAALLVSSVGVVAWALPRDRPSADELARCQASETVEGPAIELYRSSRLRADGAIEPGKRVLCSASAGAARVTLKARDALRLVPRGLRPDRLVVHLDPALPRAATPLTALETHRESASLFVRSSSEVTLESSAWLHEFAHLLARGKRPQTRTGRRVFAAIEEGVSDYYAAVINGSARLSGSKPARDLDRPPRVPPEYWVTLLAPSFDPHPFGWEFAAALWQIEKQPGPLIHDLLQGLSAQVTVGDPPAGAEPTPAGVSRVFVLRCPERSRQVIARALERAFGLHLELERID
jgi:hypothetical protein